MQAEPNGTRPDARASSLHTPHVPILSKPMTELDRRKQVLMLDVIDAWTADLHLSAEATSSLAEIVNRAAAEARLEMDACGAPAVSAATLTSALLNQLRRLDLLMRTSIELSRHVERQQHTLRQLRATLRELRDQVSAARAAPELPTAAPARAHRPD